MYEIYIHEGPIQLLAQIMDLLRTLGTETGVYAGRQDELGRTSLRYCRIDFNHEMKWYSLPGVDVQLATWLAAVAALDPSSSGSAPSVSMFD